MHPSLKVKARREALRRAEAARRATVGMRLLAITQRAVRALSRPPRKPVVLLAMGLAAGVAALWIVVLATYLLTVPIVREKSQYTITFFDADGRLREVRCPLAQNPTLCLELKR